MRTTHLIVAVSCCLTLAPWAHAQSKYGAAKQPNILFIAIDDLNDWVGCLGGHPQARTPNLDRLAKRSLLFTRAYCAAPACNPSRTAILTGLRPSTTGVYHNDQPWRPALPDAVTLPAYLLRHGFLVWGGGKIFHGGFQDAKAWSEYFTGKSKVPAKELPMRGISGNMTWGPLNAGDEALPDTQMTDWAIQKLQQKYDAPFFLAVGYPKPHLAWHAPKKYFELHPLDKIQLPKVLANDLDDVPTAGIKMARPQGDHKQIVDAGLWHEAVQAYLASCTYMDHQLGRLLDALEKSGHADTEKWRYIRYADGGEELYDHDADPLEWRNLAKDAQWARVREELAAQLPKVNAADAASVKEKKTK
jgi:arylsulfatase A-like enzyme